MGKGVPQLGPDELSAELATVPAWTHRAGWISRVRPFPDFVTAIRFVNAVARAAEAANHHPDIDIRWRTVSLALVTHDAGGLSELDIDMARAIDALTV